MLSVWLSPAPQDPAEGAPSGLDAPPAQEAPQLERSTSQGSPPCSHEAAGQAAHAGPEQAVRGTSRRSGVLLCELDWQDYCRRRAVHDARLRPPFDLLLVADVVRQPACLPLCTPQ